MSASRTGRRAISNERLTGMALGALTLKGKLDSPELSEIERRFLETLAPAFSDLVETSEQTLYMDGAARLLSSDRFADLSEVNDLLRMLERRVTLLSVLRSALGEPAVFLRIGRENSEPELQSASLVAANYGLAHRTFGTVSVIGPVRMDYAAGDPLGPVRRADFEPLHRRGLRID